MNSHDGVIAVKVAFNHNRLVPFLAIIHCINLKEKRAVKLSARFIRSFFSTGMVLESSVDTVLGDDGQCLDLAG